MGLLNNFKNKKFHFIGIGGISMSALALFLKREGFYVQGSDEVKNQEVKKLIKKKIRVFVGQKKENVFGADIVVYSSAIRDDNEELQYAKTKGLVLVKRAQLLGMIAERYKNVIAISGSHGKTTATAMIAEIFEKSGLKPTVHLGGVSNLFKSNYKIGNKKIFITENCEYMDNFLYVKPDISVILNIDSDHLDYFRSIDGVKKSFYNYAKITKEGGLNLVNDCDENSKCLLKLDNCVRFGTNSSCDIYADNIVEYKQGYFCFDVVFCGCNLGNIKLNIIGKHNVFNALVSVFVALLFDIKFSDAKQSIENYLGVERRCQKIKDINGVSIYHDYAHHPRQIESMIKTANELKATSKNKVIVVFEPHTYSRTKFLFDDFVKSLLLADEIVILPAYAARENSKNGTESIEIAREMAP